MKKLIKVVFSEFNESVSVELDDSRSPRTVKAILENLPIETIVNKWGQELYTGRTPIVAQEENAKSEVGLLDVAFWPEGNALCLFYGPTPISKVGKIVPASPVNIVGRIVSRDKYEEAVFPSWYNSMTSRSLHSLSEVNIYLELINTITNF